jgi:hypothetical protein
MTHYLYLETEIQQSLLSPSLRLACETICRFSPPESFGRFSAKYFDRFPIKMNAHFRPKSLLGHERSLKMKAEMKKVTKPPDMHGNNC